MKLSFWRSALLSVLMLSALTTLEAVQRSSSGSAARHGLVEKIVLTLHNRGLNKESTEQQTAGYYEGLLNEGSRVSTMSLIAGTRQQVQATESPFRAVRRRQRQADRYLHRGDFLYYEPKPNIDVPDYDDTRLRLVTNSHGLADREYAVAKPPQTRRMVLLGDSITRGMGTPFGTNFESRLENRLNERHTSGTIKHFEILNFAVSGYRLTQMFDVALEKVPPFEPDVYLIALTENSGSRKWGEHLAQLALEGIDLKYDFLKQVVHESGIAPGDAESTTEAKLAPFRIATERWMLATLAARAKKDGAAVVALMVPSAEEPAALEKGFEGARDLLAELDIPNLDLLDTFGGISDLAPYRVSATNFHPNERGHELVFRNLYAKILADRRVSSILLGDGATTSVAPAAGSRPAPQRAAERVMSEVGRGSSTRQPRE